MPICSPRPLSAEAAQVVAGEPPLWRPPGRCIRDLLLAAPPADSFGQISGPRGFGPLGPEGDQIINCRQWQPRAGESRAPVIYRPTLDSDGLGGIRNEEIRAGSCSAATQAAAPAPAPDLVGSRVRYWPTPSAPPSSLFAPPIKLCEDRLVTRKPGERTGVCRSSEWH